MSEETGTDTLRAVVRAADLALDEAASQAGLPSWVLPHLVAVERRRTGRFGTGGINTKFEEAIECLLDGREALQTWPRSKAGGVASAPEVRLRWIELKNFRQFAGARIGSASTRVASIPVVSESGALIALGDLRIV